MELIFSKNSTAYDLDHLKDCNMGNIGRLISIILAVIITVFGTVGNVLVCFAFAIGPRQVIRSSSTFIICLAVSDLLTCLSVLPFDIIYWIEFPIWTLGPIVCKLWNSLFFTFLTVSSLCLTTMSLDIHFAVFKPLSYNSFMTMRRCRKIIACIWLYGVLVGIIFYVYQKDPPDKSYLFEIPIAMYGFYLITHLCIPSLIVPIIYFKLFKVSLRLEIEDRKLKARKFSYVFRSRRFRSRNQSSVKSHSVEEGIAINPLINIRDQANSKNNANKSGQDSANVIKTTDELRLAKTFLFVSFGFLCLWIPFIIVQLFYVFSLQHHVDPCHLYRADTIVTWFSYIQCCLNPVIYSLRQHKVRAALKRRFFGDQEPAETDI